MGWDRKEFARRLGISLSRLGDYEAGRTRGRQSRPASIPKLVELACRYLSGERAPLSEAEWIAAWRDVSHLPDHRKIAGLPSLEDAAISRETIYGARGR